MWFLLFILIGHTLINASFITIDRPGVYNFGGDIIFDPTVPNESIVEITVSDVVLDFGEHSLSQNPLNTQPGINGITIDPDISNIVVRNGMILNTTGRGIIVGDGVQDIVVEDMTINGCIAGGVLFDGQLLGSGIETVSVKNCMIESCTGDNGGFAVGLKINRIKNFCIENCSFLDNDAVLSSSGFGCFIEDSQNGRINGCTMQNNGGSGEAIGCFLLSCTNVILKNDTAIQNRCRDNFSQAFAAGFTTRFCRCIIFKNCESLQNLSDQQSAFGFNCESGLCATFNECCAEGNRGNGICAGFRLLSEVNSIIKQCISNINTSIAGTAYGIFLAESGNDRCYIAENEIVGNAGVTSRGIVDARTSSTSFFQKNNAFNNGTNYAISYPLTITLPLITGSLSLAVPGLPALLAGELDNVNITP